jgi:glucokinase
MYLLGFDIGGTKCAVITAIWDGEKIEICKKAKCETERIPPEEMIEKLSDMADSILDRKPDAIGISCGGPLDSRRGIVLSPPNLPGWDNVEIVKLLEARFGVKATLQNDANACAAAEWKFGAGQGKENLVFLTFGTGMGAGLILNGKMYSGTNDNAGEVGHIRLEDSGPVGFGKAGSFEGFCSGSGIAQLGYAMALEAMEKGIVPSYFTPGAKPGDITAKQIAEAAAMGDETAKAVYRLSGEKLGEALAVLIDILNPQAIIIGSIFSRSRSLMWEYTEKVLKREALAASLAACEILPAKLGESIGDYAAIAAAIL